jgi:hypothetical protein
MPNLTLSLANGEPIVDVQISATALYANATLRLRGLPAPRPIDERFLIDTGASHSLIAAGALKPMGLPHSGSVVANTAIGSRRLPKYDVSLLIKGTSAGQGWQLAAISMTAADDAAFAGKPYRGLIGRDVLNLGLMIYNGRNDHLTLAY